MFLRREHLAALVIAVSLAASAQPSHAQWPVNGVPVCTAPNDQYLPTMVPDGAGGAIVAWRDQRTGYHIYAQHVLESGMVDPVWTAANGNADGTPLCTADGSQQYQTIVTDGAGGAIVTWYDGRAGGTNVDIYAQHVLSTGEVDPAWPADGRALCTAANHQLYPIIATDGAGGAIVAWMDERQYPNTNNYQLYAQHVLASGAVDPAWTTSNGNADGTLLCAASGHTGIVTYISSATTADYPAIVTDGAGGAIVTWSVTGTGTTVVQHVLASGVVDSAWTAANGNADGTPLGGADPPGGSAATLITDGAGGAIVTWHDGRGADTDIYAQHVLASGVVDAVWTAANGNSSGTPVCTAGGYQQLPTIVTDGAGGAIVTWATTNYDSYAQHVLASGAVDPTWPTDGRELGLTGGWPTIVMDGAGGAIVTASSGFNIYVQRVLSTGEVDPAWPAGGREIPMVSNGVAPLPTSTTDESGGAIVAWMQGTNGFIDIYAQRVHANGGIAAVAPRAPANFAMHAPHPNPAHPAATISFDLPSPQRVAVGVYDVTGQLVRTLAGGGELSAGTHSLVWNGASDSGVPARAGIYFIRVSTKSAVETRKVAIIL